MVRLKARATGLGPRQEPLKTEERGEKGQRFNLGDRGKGCGRDAGAEMWLETGQAAASPGSGGGRRAASSGGPVRAARPATGLGRGKRRGGGAAEEAAGLGVGRWGRAPRSAASGPEARWPVRANRRRARRDCACVRRPPEGRGRGGGAGGGARRGGGGDARSGPRTITNRSPFRPPPLSRPFPAPRDALTQAQGPCGPPAAAASAGGASVARSVRRPRSGASLLRPQHPLQRPHFRFPCHSGKWIPEVPPYPARPLLASACSPFLRALGTSPQVSCGALPSSLLYSLPCPCFACSLRDLGLYLSFRCIPQSCVHITAAWRWHSGQCVVTSR